MESIRLTIDGRPASAGKGETLLDAARAAGIEIPTLCHHRDLLPYGGCRLCLVELRQGNRSQLVASCGYPAREGLEVLTDSVRVVRARMLVLEVLLALMRGSGEIRRLAARYGVTATRYRKGLQHCILCGLCVRYCAEIKGAHAIGFVGRGVSREVAWIPSSNYRELCAGCQECKDLCPTGVFPSNWGLTDLSGPS
jgi:bidirectional [NiFe] hydrogenase diaphorase subunit